MKIGSYNFPEENKSTENVYSRNLKKKRILKFPKFQIPENSKLPNFQIPENSKLQNFQIPENNKLPNFQIPEIDEF